MSQQRVEEADGRSSGAVPSVLVIMGVAGAGKTTIGSMLAESLGWEFADADSFHPPANVAKMATGTPLDDADREPWLDALRACILGWTSTGNQGVLACSALKHAYREVLRVENGNVAFIYLHAEYEVLKSRLSTRSGHFMKPRMLSSQLETLEEPEDAVYVDASQSPINIVYEIIEKLHLTKRSST